MVKLVLIYNKWRGINNAKITIDNHVGIERMEAQEPSEGQDAHAATTRTQQCFSTPQLLGGKNSDTQIL